MTNSQKSTTVQFDPSTQQQGQTKLTEPESTEAVDMEPMLDCKRTCYSNFVCRQKFVMICLYLPNTITCNTSFNLLISFHSG